MNFTTPRYAILFSNSQNHIVHVINHEWNRSMNVASAVSFVWDTKPDFPSDQTKNIFVLFVCFWKWFVLPMFFKVFQVVFVWKTCVLGVFRDSFHEWAQLGVKWSNSQVFQLWTESFATVSRVRFIHKNSHLIAKITRPAF